MKQYRFKKSKAKGKAKESILATMVEEDKAVVDDAESKENASSDDSDQLVIVHCVYEL